MRKLTSGAAAIAMALTIAGCTTAAPAEPATSPAAVTTGSSEPPTSTTEDPATSTSDQADPGATAPSSTAAPVDQSTPEKVMTAWLTALVGGDSANVCGLMAANGTAIADLPNAKEQCAKAVTPMLEQLASVKDAFKGLTVTGATVKGDTATFDQATTTPTMAGTIIRNLKAVRIGGKWYITQG